MTTQVADTELKYRHRAMWSSGDYPLMVETFLLPIGERLVDAAGIEPDARVLDVASGTGNAALPAARKGADVTASDLTPSLLEAGRARAKAEGLELQWVEADAENLPFENESYDVVLSTITIGRSANCSSGPPGERCRTRIAPPSASISVPPPAREISV